MRVFTHYWEVPGTDGEGVRWRTLLQFGDSWEVRGSAVMKNPGAADFRDPARRAIFDPALLYHLSAFDDNPSPTINEDPRSVFEANINPQFDDDPGSVFGDNQSQRATAELNTAWYEFNADATMRAVAELFNEYYDLRGEKLEGVIQIFNLFYIKEVNLGKALKKSSAIQLITSKQTTTQITKIHNSQTNSTEHKINTDKSQRITTTQTTLSHNNVTDTPQNYPTLFENMAEYDITHLTVPVYLGFGNLAKDKTYGPIARQFFEAAKALGMNYLHPYFDQNDFTHPLYLMNYGKNKPASALLRSRFLRNSL
ncbi:MAG: hypothetical protein LUC24_03520 [Bacteroidales bacterium]|nr:hypothetical protein [Bacteroidales bacterium]